MTTTAVRTSLIPIYTYPTKISIKITLKSIQNDIFVVYIMSTHTKKKKKHGTLILNCIPKHR